MIVRVHGMAMVLAIYSAIEGAATPQGLCILEKLDKHILVYYLRIGKCHRPLFGGVMPGLSWGNMVFSWRPKFSEFDCVSQNILFCCHRVECDTSWGGFLSMLGDNMHKISHDSAWSSAYAQITLKPGPSDTQVYAHLDTHLSSLKKQNLRQIPMHFGLASNQVWQGNRSSQCSSGLFKVVKVVTGGPL